MGDISGVYMIINLKNGKCYIGSSKNIENRWENHRKALNNKDHFNNYLQNSWNKYGEESFKFVILEETGNKLEREQFYIDQYDPEYNILEDVKANPMQGRRHTEEAKEKISEMLSGENNPIYGKERPRKVKEKMIKTLEGKMAGENNPFYGKEHSKKAKQKMSEAHKGKEFSKEHRQKLSKAQEEREYSKERNRKISEAQRGEKGNNSKLTKRQVRIIKHLLNNDYFHQKEIAKMFDVARRTITDINTGATWSHIKLEE